MVDVMGTELQRMVWVWEILKLSFPIKVVDGCDRLGEVIIQNSRYVLVVLVIYQRSIDKQFGAEYMVPSQRTRTVAEVYLIVDTLRSPVLSFVPPFEYAEKQSVSVR